MNKEEIIEFDQLWDSMMKCKRGVSWKPSTKSFTLNGIINIERMSKSLKNGTWVNGRPKEIKILYPKRRDGLSISFKDRVYQRSINDNVLYPLTTKSFIFDNAACQKKKGTSFARRRVKEKLWNYYRRYGKTGYVLQIDIHGYYPSMRHDVVKDIFHKYIDGDVYDMVCDVLDEQYNGEVGYNPGSQMVQIAGITVLNGVDHKIKEQYGEKYYFRYMDDFLIFNNDYDKLKTSFDEIVNDLTELGFEINDKKTQIRPISKGFLYLGFHYRITNTGKIIMTLNSASIKHERKKLFRLVKLAKQGEITKEKADECYKDWKTFAEEGNTFKMLCRMDSYYKNLWREL